MPGSWPRSAAASGPRSGGCDDRAARRASGGSREGRPACRGGDRDASQGARDPSGQARGGGGRPGRARASPAGAQGDAGPGQHHAQRDGEARPMSEPQRVEVEILGQKYTIRSEADPKHVRDIAAYVEKRAKSVEGQLRGPDPVKALALASLYIADELFRAREDLSKYEGDLPKRIGAMVDLLDAITPGKGQR